MNKIRIIFLCTGNSARSQMAEAMLRKHAGDYFEVYSAGFEPKPIHRFTRLVMEEAGYDLDGQESKPLSKYLGKIHFGIMVTVCRKVEDKCPTLPGVGTRLFWDIKDPAAVKGNDEERLQAFRDARDTIKEKMRLFLEERQIPSSNWS
jgi:arsenate reductase